MPVSLMGVKTMQEPDQAGPSRPVSQSAKSRRAFLLLLPASVIASVVGTLVTAALRFFRPSPSAPPSAWIDVALVSELKGNGPIVRKVFAEHLAGWARTRVGHLVYVLPAKNNQVLSAVCPHEGCEVAWRNDGGVFSCPCHDSNFAPDGSQLSGPAHRGLDPLPARIQNGVLQIQYQFFENSAEERIIRG